MTALETTERTLSLATRRRRFALRRDEWMERRATTGARLVRLPFRAQLALEAWAAAAWPAHRRRALADRVRAVLAGLIIAGLRATGVLVSWAIRRVVVVARSGSALARSGAVVVRSAARRANVSLPAGRAVVWVDATDQVRLARSTTAAALILAVLSMAATSAVRPTNSLRVATSSANGRTARPDAGVKADPSRRAPVKPTRPAPVAAPAPVAPASPPVPTVPPAPPGLHGALPVGKGMWIWHPNQTDGGDPAAIAARAEAVGLTHVYVWLGSSVSGFATGNFLNGFLPVAHAHGLRVYGWDFPYLDDADGDVNRAVSDILYTTPSGDRIDGFAADIELRSMGVNLSPATATVYTTHLRQRVGPAYPLIAVVPRPSAALVDYPYNEVIGQFDAVAPMVYWLNRDPAADVSGALQSLARFQKPVMPIGQAYDGAEDGGPPGRPNRQALLRFTSAAEGSGASGVSLWSWQHADQQEWDALRDAPQFVLPAGAVVFSPAQYRAYQVLLTSLGFPAPATGVWDQASAKALADFQAAAHLPVTGVIDPLTRKLLLQPFRTPVKG